MKILVAYDGSGPADQALYEGIDLAKNFKGSITVLSIFWNTTDGVKDQILLRAEKRLMETFVKHQIIAEDNQSPASQILRTARNGGFDLIIIGGNGQGNKPWMMGSTSSKVVNESPCLVLVVK
jgi:nucleotide-binding universal stress UspA family protein